MAGGSVPEFNLPSSPKAAIRAIPGMFRRMLPMLILDGIGPLVLYLLAKPRFEPASPYPLLIAIFLPLLANVVSVVRHRRLDTAGVFVVLSLCASLGVVVGGGNQRLLLLTHNLVMPAMGAACLLSLALPKPLAFYMIRQFVTGDRPNEGKAFDGLWDYAYVRTASRITSGVWGVAMLAEFGLRVVFVLTLPIALVLALSSIVMMSVGLGLGAWNVAYGLRVMRRLRALAEQQETAGSANAVDEALSPQLVT